MAVEAEKLCTRPLSRLACTVWLSTLAEGRSVMLERRSRPRHRRRYSSRRAIEL